MKNGMMNLELDINMYINMSLKSSWARNNYERQQHANQYTNPESKFFNPDAWSRLIGKSNVVFTYIDGQKVSSFRHWSSNFFHE